MMVVLLGFILGKTNLLWYEKLFHLHAVVSTDAFLCYGPVVYCSPAPTPNGAAFIVVYMRHHPIDKSITCWYNRRMAHYQDHDDCKKW